MASIITAFSDVAAFGAVAEPFLVRQEAENNLLLGILDSLRADPPPLNPETTYLGVGRDGSRVTGVVIWTAGWRAVLSAPDDANFGRAAGLAVRRSGRPVPGVLGPRAAADHFGRAWVDDGVAVGQAMTELIYRLAGSPEPPSGPGRLRHAQPTDLGLLVPRWAGFVRELEGREISQAEARAIAEPRIRFTYLWETDRPVSMAVASSPTPHGIRIGGVYTPPELRRRGYATACVTALSRRMMDEGREFCFLFTDAANPTANAIYQRIGYEQVAEVIALDFDAGTASP